MKNAIIVALLIRPRSFSRSKGGDPSNLEWKVMMRDDGKPKIETSCACPKIMDQVCGKDGLTYPNECLAKCSSQVPNY